MIWGCGRPYEYAAPLTFESVGNSVNQTCKTGTAASRRGGVQIILISSSKITKQKQKSQQEIPKKEAGDIPTNQVRSTSDEPVPVQVGAPGTVQTGIGTALDVPTHSREDF